MRLALVHALTGLAHANDEAAEQAPARLVPILTRKAREADECARAVQFDQPLTERQAALVAEAQQEIDAACTPAAFPITVSRRSYREP